MSNADAARCPTCGSLVRYKTFDDSGYPFPASLCGDRWHDSPGSPAPRQCLPGCDQPASAAFAHVNACPNAVQMGGSPAESPAPRPEFYTPECAKRGCTFSPNTAGPQSIFTHVADCGFYLPPVESPAAGGGLPEKVEWALRMYATAESESTYEDELRAAIRAELDTEYKRGWVAAKNESNVPEARHDR